MHGKLAYILKISAKCRATVKCLKTICFFLCRHVLSGELKKSIRQPNRAEISNPPLRGFALDYLHCSACEGRDPHARVDRKSQRALYSLFTLHKVAVWEKLSSKTPSSKRTIRMEWCDAVAATIVWVCTWALC